MIAATKIKPYTVLAEVYDEVMAKVDYEIWADFIDEVIQANHQHPNNVLELACGTGSFTFELEKFGYKIRATDQSREMLEKAREKANQLNSNIQFTRLDFLDIEVNQTFDVVVSVFDSVNYLLDEASLLKMFTQVKKVMKKYSIFIFDFTTPQNSLESTQFLDNRKGLTENGWHYHRKSWYDNEQQIHYNSFEIEKRADDGETIIESFTEEHKQRAYTLQNILNIIEKTDFTIKNKYGEFELNNANESSNRITMILQK